jgi:hypothetical protein
MDWNEGAIAVRWTVSASRKVFRSMQGKGAPWPCVIRHADQGKDAGQRFQEILGHNSFLTTLRYAHLAPELRQEAVERLAEVGVGHKLVTNGVPGGKEGEVLEPRAAETGRGPGDASDRVGAPRGTRTHDPVIKNHLLYQLS